VDGPGSLPGKPHQITFTRGERCPRASSFRLSGAKAYPRGRTVSMRFRSIELGVGFDDVDSTLWFPDQGQPPYVSEAARSRCTPSSARRSICSSGTRAAVASSARYLGVGVGQSIRTLPSCIHRLGAHGNRAQAARTRASARRPLNSCRVKSRSPASSTADPGAFRGETAESTSTRFRRWPMALQHTDDRPMPSA